MKFYYLLAILAFIVITQPSCNKLPDGGVPIYIKTDTTILNTTYATQGYNTQAITDAWVQTTSSPSTNLGAYQLPCTFPVLQDSTVRFLINAGVYESGQTEIREIYPFYSADTFTLHHAVPGKIYSHTPVFTYLPSTLFAFTEDFENNSDYDSMKICADAGIVKYGHRCGQITVSPTDSSVTATQSNITPYALPAGQEIWLEVDYRSDVPFWIGINGYYLSAGSTISSVDYEQVLFTLPQTQWTHLYLKLSQLISQINAGFYRLTFQAINPSQGAGGSVYLDNIKIVHF